jgi:hypothetical protein
MRHILSLIALSASIFFLGCEAETILDPELPEEQEPLEVLQFTTPRADSEFVYFSFSKGDTVIPAEPTRALNWDIAFRQTTIKINGGTSGPGKGGAAWLEGINFEDVKEVPEDFVFAVDDTNTTGFATPTGSGNGWYVYTGPPNHWILPIEDRVFIIRTADEKYAKVKFISYYRTGKPPTEPAQADSRYYTFKYVYQPNGSKKFE